VSILTELQKRRKDNRLIVGLVLAVMVAWVGVSLLEQRAAEMETETITRGLLLFVLSYINVTLIAAVLFVLFRTLIKLWLERRRGALGSRFKTKLLVTYVGLTAIPIGLVFVTATGLLQRSIDRWFSTPVREVVNKARAVEDLAEKRIENDVRDNARALARTAAVNGGRMTAAALEEFREAEGLDSVEIYVSGRRTADASGVAPLPSLPPEVLERATAGGDTTKVEVLGDGSHRVRSALRSGDAVYVAGTVVPPAEARAMKAIAQAWSDYQKLEVQKPSIKAANIATFLLITLAVLFAAIWTGLTLARRITEPIAALAESTRRIRSGDLTARVAVPSTDELGVLVDSFNEMAAGLEQARDALLQSNEDLQTSYEKLDLERRLVATVLESVTTGVVAFDADGEITLCNPAARTLLSLADPVTAAALQARPDLEPLNALLDGAPSGTPPLPARELRLTGDGGERRLEISVRPLSSASPGERGGWVLAVEDTTHVAREQKLAAWSEVARRVAHEIKNPLTPIRLSAERIARRSKSGEADLRQAIESGTRVIVEEVDILKALVDEFSRFARLPEMRPEPTDLVAVARSAARLFEGASEGVSVSVASRLTHPVVRVDPDQIKRALVNLIDNALEACGEQGSIAVVLSEREGVVTLEVADTGHGVPSRDREKLFLPDFTTKGRGTGLGLAIVSRIVADHNGTIRVEDNRPRGARFIIELPAA
jgi:nitrogen fixation/metabolism regulation signal transduction histidine kinase